MGSRIDDLERSIGELMEQVRLSKYNSEMTPNKNINAGWY